MIKAIIFDCTGVLVGADGVVNTQLLGYIRSQLKPHYKIGLLSNLSRRYIERTFTPAERLLFDIEALATEIGVAKPDPRAYRTVTKMLEVSPEQCIFVDDFPERCEAAREEGMQSVLYSSFAQMKIELEAMLETA